MQIQNKAHGVISLILFDIALVIAVYALATASLILAIAYVLIVVFCFAVVIKTFCVKCSCRENCSHVIFGKITKYFPIPKQNNYTTKDYLITLFALLIMLGLPQFWIWKTSTLAYLFWGIFGICGIEINQWVCRRCNNTKCSLCKNKNLVNYKQKHA